MKKEVLELRKKMQENGIDVYFVPSGDYHSSEYVNDYFKAREFMSGLSGESGELVVTGDGAYLWTDGRYFLQAETQLKGSDIELMRMAEPGVPTVDEFLTELAKKGSYTLGFDGKVVPGSTGLSMKENLGKLGVTIKSDKDLVGEIWSSRPALEPSKIYSLPLETVGKTAEQKIKEVRAEMADNNADYLLISDLMETAWLLNLRGADIDYTPVFFSFILLGKDSLNLYVMENALDNGKLPSGYDFVTIKGYDELSGDLASLNGSSTLWLNSDVTNFFLCTSIPKDVKQIDKATPIDMMKALKNETEVKSTINAHIKDGVAMVNFIHWLKETVNKKQLTEIDAADYLQECRFSQDGCFDLSFETISGYGPNGAIIHYAPTPETNADIKPEGFLLVDSGGQYKDGTTDITRTLAVGPLTQEMIDDYTYVLKSHIAMGTAVIRPDQTGIDLDTIVRKPLRDVGLDFKHGLGHGIGHILGVHEGPNILRRVPTPCPIKPGMIMSDEPGVYIDHKFGVRIENEVLIKDDGKGNSVFEMITFCPYEREAINTALLTDEEIAWVNDYHANVRKTLLPLVEGGVADYVKEQTEPLSK